MHSPSATLAASRYVRFLALFSLGLLACAGSMSRSSVQPVPPPLAPHHADTARSSAALLGATEGGGSAAGASGSRRREATGTWDWVFRSTTQQGDLRVEQEEWHLKQQGSRVFGYYHRQVVTMSQDQRPFRCNGMLGFVNNTRVRVLGEIHNDEVSLREVGVDADKNPCDDGGRNLTSYVGRIDGDSLYLLFAPGTGQHLTRRQENSPILPLNPEGDQKTQAEDLTQVAIDGQWDWQFRAVDPDGDLHLEREEWHLAEKNAEITGYYERTLDRRRSVGVFSCNGSSTIKSTTRYLIKGQRFGNKLTLSEVDYQMQPGPCDSRSRRLDNYQGTLLPDGQMLLSWGSGQQTLRKHN